MNCSVIIPTYNSANSLDLALEYLNKQNFNNQFEVIVIDDGSTDKTENILKEWNKKDTIFNFHYIKQINKKQASARNAGIKIAKGDIVIFIGSDIFVEENWLQEHYNFHKRFNKNTDIGLGFMTWSKEIANNRFRKWLESSGTMLSYKGLENYKKTDFWHFYTGNISIKKELLKENNFDENFKNYGWEDIMFGYELTKIGGEIYYVKNAKAYHYHKLEEKDLFPKRMLEIGKSAVLFQKKYPELNVLPKGFKLFIFKIISSIFVPSLLGLIKKELKWYAISKRYFLYGIRMAKSEDIFAIMGSFGASNIGDEAMFSVLSKYLQNHNYKTYAFTGNIKDSKEKHKNLDAVYSYMPFGFRSFFSFKWVKSLFVLPKIKLMIIGGGGLLTDHYSKKAVFLWVWQIFILSLTRTPFILFANSVGPFKSKITKYLSKQAISLSSDIIVRDELSKNEVENLLKNREVRLCSDILFYKNENFDRKKLNRFAFNIRDWKIKYDWIYDVLNNQIKNGYEVFLIPMEDKDEKMLKKLISDKIKIFKPRNFDELSNFLSSCSVACGMRLHFLIAAALSGCKIAGISYSQKVEGVLNTLNVSSIYPDLVSAETVNNLICNAKKAENLEEQKELIEKELMALIV